MLMQYKVTKGSSVSEEKKTAQGLISFTVFLVMNKPAWTYRFLITLEAGYEQGTAELLIK
jgi:hypothetical protein